MAAMSEDCEGDDVNVTIPIDPSCYVRLVTYRGCLPALVIGDSTGELILSTGPRWQDATLAKEFALHLISAAIGLAGACNRRLIPQHFVWPEQDPESERSNGNSNH
jgi:hypothetical protein